MIGTPYTPEVDPNVAAEAFTNGLLANLTANGGVEGGNLGKTTHICLKQTDGKIQVGSCDDGNEVTFYQTGADFTSVPSVVKTRVFLSKGEVYVEDGCEDGTVVTSTKGICGASGNVSGSNESPMPLGVEGYAGRQFFLFAFRNSTGGTGTNRGEVYVAAGAVESEVSLLNGAGDAIVDGPYTIPAFGLQTFLTNANSEFQVVATQAVFVGIAAAMDTTNPRFYDMRLVPPLSTNIIGQNRNGRLSALYDNTEVWWYRRNGGIGKVTVSPGSPSSIYTGTINELGDVFTIKAASTPATGGTFTITINAETTGTIAYNADAGGILTALDGLASYSSADFKVEMTLGSNLGEADAEVTIYAMGLLTRIVGSPSIDTALIVGNVPVLTIVQAGNVENNAGSSADYDKAGIVNLLASGPISCLSGADGAGLEATYFVPVSALTQRIPLYLGTVSTGNGDQSSIAIQSPYQGNFKIFDQSGVLKYSGSFTRAITAGSRKGQLHPCGWTIATGAGGDEAWTEDWAGGYIESDVPINLVMNSDGNSSLISGGIVCDDDEIVFYGVTPPDTRAELRADANNMLRKRTIDASGVETWELV